MSTQTLRIAVDPMPRRRPPSLAEVAYRNLLVARDKHGELLYGGGVRGSFKAMKKAAEACGVSAALAIAAQRGAGADGGWPTQQEYARYWQMSERSAQREWDLFKQAFPGEESPDRIAMWARNAYGARLANGTGDDPSPLLSAPAEEAGVIVA